MWRGRGLQLRGVLFAGGLRGGGFAGERLSVRESLWIYFDRLFSLGRRGMSYGEAADEMWDGTVRYL